MRKGIIILFMTIVIVILSGCLDYFNDWGHYDIQFNRYFNSEEERMAIDVVENLNYSYYSNHPRFDGSWSNYIDYETLRHYNQSYFNSEEKELEHDITYVYQAWGVFYQKMDLIISNNDCILNVEINNRSVLENRDHYSSGLIDYYGCFIGRMDNNVWNIMKGNDTLYDDNVEDIIYHDSIDNVYVVYMYLSYSDYWGILAGVGTDIHQIVLLDFDYNVLFMIYSPEKWIS